MSDIKPLTPLTPEQRQQALANPAYRKVYGQLNARYGSKLAERYLCVVGKTFSPRVEGILDRTLTRRQEDAWN